MTGRPVTRADEVHFAATPDGWRLALHRHRPAGARDAVPVLLCAGYGCNRHFLDFDERYSLAGFLQRRGFDVWIVELRGRGLSHATRYCRRPGVWTFDDLARIDLPAVIGYVRAATGRRVGWVGHSLGGLVLYACLGCRSDLATWVESGVTIGSPVVFPALSVALFGRIGHVLLRLPLGDTVPQRLVLGLLWNLASTTTALGVGMNPDNVDRRVVGRVLRRALGDVSRHKLRQLATWALDGVFASADGAIDYRAALARVRPPLLVTAGSADRLATPAAVACALDYLPPGLAVFREFGRAAGDSVEYGHVDLILGRAAPREVFPTVAAWLEEHSGARGKQ